MPAGPLDPELHPAALDEPERPHDPLGSRRAHVADAQDCPCWSCSRRRDCAIHCEPFTRYLRSKIKCSSHPYTMCQELIALSCAAVPDVAGHGSFRTDNAATLSLPCRPMRSREACTQGRGAVHGVTGERKIGSAPRARGAPGRGQESDDRKQVRRDHCSPLSRWTSGPGTNSERSHTSVGRPCGRRRKTP
jgi:hypothetical protein